MKQKKINLNDVKKGAFCVRINGDIVELMDSKKGIIRMIKAPLFYDNTQTEIGSCYINELRAVITDGKTIEVEYSPAQLKRLKLVEASGF